MNIAQTQIGASKTGLVLAASLALLARRAVLGLLAMVQ